MNRLVLLLLLAVPLAAFAQNTKRPTTLRGVLLEELRTTHTPGGLVCAGERGR